MWVLWAVLSLSARVPAQDVHASNNGARFEWGWQLDFGAGNDPATSGQYYVRLPQAEHHVRYAADGSGYHGAVSINTNDERHSHASQFALGGRAIELLRNENQPESQNIGFNTNPHLNQQINLLQDNLNKPLEIYLLQDQFTSTNVDGANGQLFNVLQNPLYGLNQYNIAPNNLSPTYTNVVQHPTNEYQYQNQGNQVKIETNEQRNVSSSTLSYKEVSTESYSEQQPVIQVFKDHNCTQDDTVQTNADIMEVQINYGESKASNENINGRFGEKVTNAGTQNEQDGPKDRQNSRSERVLIHYNQAEVDRETEGINRLVASTQDLISNEDLLNINHAIEKYSTLHTDDIIKPRSKLSLNTEQSQYNFNYQPPRSTITVRAKVGNIVNSHIEHVENNPQQQQEFQTNQYRFASPIIVQDPSEKDFQERVVNNIVSTVSPYLEQGYEVSSIRNTLNNFQYESGNNVDSVDVTPRPVGPKYLAPITVALRLLNSNDSDLYNTVDDHEGSDSELVEDSVKPSNEKTVVEVQKSIPLAITHINSVEQHKEYLIDGNKLNNGAKELYNEYMNYFDSSINKQEKNNENHQYETSGNEGHNGETNNLFKDTNDNLESSANIQTEVEVSPYSGDSSNQRREFVRPSQNRYNNNIIQPIIIEKEVAVTKYVDRFVEKPVHYPEPVEVIKEVEKAVVVPIPVEKIVNRPVEVTKYVDRPYAVQVPQPYPFEVKVPYPVESKVYVDRPIHVPYPIEKLVEKQILHPYPVPTPVAVPVRQNVYVPVPFDNPVPVPYEVEKPVQVATVVEKEVPVPYPVEKPVPYPVHVETKVPVPVTVEKRVPVAVPVNRIVEKPVTVTKVVEKPVRVEVPYPQPVPVAVHYPQPYPVERIVEKKVPYPVPVDRIVEKKVPVEVRVPYERVVQKIVEKPVVVTKYVDKPYPVETKVPYPVERIVEKRVPYPVQVPYEVKVPYSVEKVVEKPVHVPYKVPYPIHTILPVPFRVPYSQQQFYSHHKFTPDQPKFGVPPPYLAQKLHKSLENKNRVQTTMWGNQYASSYQYINTSKDDIKNPNLYEKYMQYLTNNNKNNGYYGPAPLSGNPDSWSQGSTNYEVKVRRTDRTPKNLRIEYGGFKPPLIPSTEVDLDGVPIKREKES